MPRVLWALAIAASCLVGGPSRAGTVESFFHGHQIALIVGTGPGGGNDIYARLVARYLGDHIPGRPTVVVQNMPGAGGLVAANYLFQQAPKDGTTIGTFDRGVPLLAILGGEKNVHFDPMKFDWLGSTSSYENDSFLLFARKDAAAASLDAIRKKGGPPLLVGVTGQAATDTNVALLLRDVLDLNLKIIPGYPDGSSISIAVDRKEVDARLLGLSAVNTSRPGWLKADSPMHPLLQFGRETRLPRFADIPTAREIAPNGPALAVVELAELPYRIARPFTAPPDTPIDRYEALRAAFMATMTDPRFVAESNKLNIELSPIDGKAVSMLMQKLAEAPPAALARMKALQAAQVAR